MPRSAPRPQLGMLSCGGGSAPTNEASERGKNAHLRTGTVQECSSHTAFPPRTTQTQLRARVYACRVWRELRPPSVHSKLTGTPSHSISSKAFLPHLRPCFSLPSAEAPLRFNASLRRLRSRLARKLRVILRNRKTPVAARVRNPTTIEAVILRCGNQRGRPGVGGRRGTHMLEVVSCDWDL